MYKLQGLRAQSDNASVSGTVRDSVGGVVPNAAVVLTDERTGFERRTITNESGYYVITGVSPGFFSVSAQAAGFKITKQTHNAADAGCNSPCGTHSDIERLLFPTTNVPCCKD